jgi:hypothetical protein
VASAALKELLRELGEARGLRGRLRILSRSFDLLRNMTAADRERVALEVGSDWAWKQVERTFMKDGKLSDGEQVIRQAFETIGSADPAELRQAARRIRERDTEGLEQAAIQTLERILEEDGPEVQDADEVEQTQGLETIVDVALSSVAGDEETEAAEAEAEVVQSAALPPEEAPPEPESRRLPNPGQPVVRSAPPPARAPKRSMPRSAPRPRAAEPGPVPLAPAAEFPTSRERLGALRRLRAPGYGAQLGSETRRSWIEGLASHWAGRRALSAMIKDGALDDVDEALTLVSLLARDSDKVWCLIDWIETQPVEEAERARVLDAAPTPTARRRLERRIA